MTKLTTTTAANALIPRPTSLIAASLDLILVDGSGSMIDKWWDFLAALEKYRSELATQHLHSQMLVYTFATEDHALLQRNATVETCESFLDVPLQAYFSGTPLYDSINMAGRTLRDLDPAPGKCRVLIVTDGDENESKYTNVDQCRAIINWMKAKGWEVTFMGCDFNNSRQAQLLGVDESNAIGIQRKLLTQAAEMLARKTMHHARTGESINFTKDEQVKFGGLLNGPAKGNA